MVGFEIRNVKVVTPLTKLKVLITNVSLQHFLNTITTDRKD